MTETNVDNTVSYTQKPGWKMLAFLCVFLIAGAISIVKFDSYFTDFWKIRKCNPEGYARGDFMTACAGIKVDRYAFGSIYLGSQKNAVKNAKTADVIVFGNSRTMRSFSTDAIDNYFKSKGLTYVIFAVEGASYASAQHTVEKLGLKPKIVMTNTEILYSNVVGSAFGDLVYFPDKYKTRFDFFHAAQSFHKWACESKFQKLKDIYCKGRTGAGWRSAVTGRFKWELVAEPEKNILFAPRKEQNPPDLRLGRVLPNGREFLGNSNFKDSCHVLYIVNSPSSEPILQNALAAEIGALPVYSAFDDLKTYDKSHLDRPTSERWASAFVKDLDPALNKCLQGEGRYKSEVIEKFDIATADIDGVTDFETWIPRVGITVTDAAAQALDKTKSADIMVVEKAGARLQKIYRDVPIKAGMTVTFSGWFWADEDVPMRAQIVRSCSAETPVETVNKIFNLTSKPKRYEVSHTFKQDHACALIQITSNLPESQFYGWQYRMDFVQPTTQTKSEIEPTPVEK